VADEIPRCSTLTKDVTAAVPLTVSLRPVDNADEPLLLRIFGESHCAGFELLGLEPVALDQLIRMQFQARQAQYRMHPGAAEYLIWRGTGPEATPVGNCWLSDSTDRLRVLDIAVLAEYRRRGVARAVLAELCAQAATAGKPIGLSVWRENAPACQLYRALGFVPDPTVGGSGEPGDLGNGYLELRYPPGDAPHTAAAWHRTGTR
jgi:ribosomal protein S18 acetylase RimI-like enzyme